MVSPAGESAVVLFTMLVSYFVFQACYSAEREIKGRHNVKMETEDLLLHTQTEAL